jgi:CheY-like chemotaxis protein
MRILLVDDDIGRAKIMQESLQLQFNWEIVNATTPKETLQILDKDKNFDVILLDIMMAPDDSIDNSNNVCEDGISTGVVLLKTIKDKIGNIPVMAFTGRDDMDFLKDSGDVIEIIKKPKLAIDIHNIISGKIKHTK